MADILNEVVNKLPKDADITSSNFEAANIILYTKNIDFFNDKVIDILFFLGGLPLRGIR